MEAESTPLHAVIIGAGQAGLATGYFLKKNNKDFIILDKNEKIGDSWRMRWDSLFLFTPSQHDVLPEMSFPGLKNSFPSKDQMADYLETYAKHFSLPVQLGVNVTRLSAKNNHYEIETSAGKFISERVVIATGNNPYPYIPSFASELGSDIFQVHSSGYLNPESLPQGDVLVVGSGTSGIEIALEVSKTHKTYISGKPTFHIPDNVLTYAGNMYWWFLSHILTVRTPIGKKVKKKVINGGAPLIRVSASDLQHANVKPLPRVTGVSEGLPQFEDGSTLNVSTIIWSTGYKPDFSWIDLDVVDESGWPTTKRGVSTHYKGLYFNGMPFQYGLTSGLVGGVGRDANYISRHMNHHALT